MATETATGTRVQTWLTPGFARELKELAEADGRSVSNLIRQALEHFAALPGEAERPPHAGDRLVPGPPPTRERRLASTLPSATKHDPDGVGWCVQHYGLSRETYEAVVRIALELLDDPDFQRATQLVARGLMAAPVLDAESLEILRAETAFADPEHEGALTTCSI